MNRGRSVCLLLCLCLCSAPLSGCWDDRELNELGITSASSYDWKDNEWIATYQVINPSSGVSGTSGGSGAGSSSSPPFVTFTARGKTIMEAVERTNLLSTRQMFFAHSRITVIGEGLAKHGIHQLIDLFLRKQDARETVFVFIAEGEAGKILAQLMQMAKNQGAGVQLMMEQEEKLLSYYSGTRLFELAMDIASESASAVIPQILLTGGELMDRSDEVSVTDLPSRLALGRLAVLKKDKMIGWLSQEQAFGLTFLTNKIESATIAFPSDPKQSDETDASFMLQTCSTKVRPIWEKDHYVMDVSIHGHGVLNEVGSAMDMNSRETISTMEKSIEQVVLGYVNESWQAVHRLGADVTGFAVQIHRSDRKRWKQIQKDKSWDTVFKDIEIRPHVSIKIDRTGLSSKSYKAIQPK
ncbi:Ger(x)C family spore germination protein [Paenibacillus sp. NFR01]|uniref:Ger(x)C family spore germination protein n=1 Tax=Paenibacillus sp. NFR01 TaxID=1566279 RepID=UPI0008CE16D4|nr:Ger(x)C family spore germination protein [Paenibacillus sp. NFR01]SET97426.1 spore germination protein KC [Paenibacillus sp. NFR01]